jgi:hypothetical protein
VIGFNATKSIIQQEFSISMPVTIIGGIVAYFGYGGGLTLVALDETNFSKNSLTQALSKKLHFIENQELVEEFAHAMYGQYDSNPKIVQLKLTKDEQLDILEQFPVDLNQNELELINTILN